MEEEEEKKKKSQFVGNRKEKKKTVCGREKGKGREGKIRFYRCFDGRSSIIRELKLVHAMRATHGYRNLSFSWKFQEVGVFSYTSSSLFKSHKWLGSSAQTRD